MKNNILTLTEYQQRAHRTTKYPTHLSFQYLMPGLVAQLDQVEAMLMMYEIAPSRPRRQELIEEYGHCIWFIAEICTALNMDLMLVEIEDEDEALSLDDSSMTLLRMWLKALEQAEGDLPAYLRTTNQQEEFRYILLDMLNEISGIARFHFKSTLDALLRASLKEIKGKP